MWGVEDDLKVSEGMTRRRVETDSSEGRTIPVLKLGTRRMRRRRRKRITIRRNKMMMNTKKEEEKKKKNKKKNS